MSKKISLTKGKFAIVDDEDYRFLNNFTWKIVENLENGCEAVATQCTSMPTKGKAKAMSVMMVKFLIRKKANQRVIHKNKNSLDNRKENLEVIAMSNVIQRNKKMKDASSIYKGVCFNKLSKKWEVGIAKNNKRIHLGLFMDEKTAARAYNKIALILYGDDAYQNDV